MYSAMAETTAEFMKALFDYYDGVRGMAHSNNLEISDWYAEDEEMRKDANIIAMDYLVSSDIVDTCIFINRERMEDPAHWNTYNDRY